MRTIERTKNVRMISKEDYSSVDQNLKKKKLHVADVRIALDPLPTIKLTLIYAWDI